jgi:8-oxo-dGTP diphosphatase
MDTKGAADRPQHDSATFRPLVTVDVAIFCLRDDDLQVLLACPGPEGATWAIPGGSMERDESLEATAVRTLEDQTGLRDVYLEQLYTFGQPDYVPGGPAIAVMYLAVVSAGDVARGPEAGAPARSCRWKAGLRVRWWSIYDLPPLAFDHAAILRYALTRLRFKLEYTAVGFELLPPTFTLSELQKAYEVILGEELDKRNFRRKILAAGIIEPSGGTRSGEGRPAQLYRYREDAVAEVKARRLFP